MVQWSGGPVVQPVNTKSTKARCSGLSAERGKWQDLWTPGGHHNGVHRLLRLLPPEEVARLRRGRAIEHAARVAASGAWPGRWLGFFFGGGRQKMVLFPGFPF